MDIVSDDVFRTIRENAEKREDGPLPGMSPGYLIFFSFARARSASFEEGCSLMTLFR